MVTQSKSSSNLMLLLVVSVLIGIILFLMSLASFNLFGHITSTIGYDSRGLCVYKEETKSLGLTMKDTPIVLDLEYCRDGR